MITVQSLDVKPVEMPAPQEGPGAIRKTLGWGFTAVQIAAPLLGKFDKVADFVSPEKLEIAGKAAAVGNGSLAFEAHVKEIVKPEKNAVDQVGHGVGMVSTALGIAATVGELALPYVPAAAAVVPVIGQAAVITGYAGMAFNLGRAVYNAATRA